jgi:sulfite reductase (NADPH) hemoprotein beta-component
MTEGPAYKRWLERNVHAHRVPGYRSVTLSLKRAGLAPGDASADQMDAAAELAERFSLAELRVSHDQNLVLPWVREAELPALWEAAKRHGFATPNIGYLTDMIACPGGDVCALANARSLPIAAAITERFDDLDELHDIGDIDLHISGCINSCGHHHSGHIGILGVDKDGKEWYQVSLGGMDGSALGGPAAPGKVIGPSFAADEVPDVIEAVIDAYRDQRSACRGSASSTPCGGSASSRSRAPRTRCAAPRRCTREHAGHEARRRQPRPLARAVADDAPSPLPAPSRTAC